jgi:hypothetical protein
MLRTYTAGFLTRAALATPFFLVCISLLFAKDEMTSSLLIGSARIDIRMEWNLDDALRIGDRTVGVDVLEPLYAKMKDKPAPVDLASPWMQLGDQSDGAGVRFDDNATLADVRRAITTRESAPPPDPTFFKLLAVFVGRALGPMIGLAK